MSSILGSKHLAEEYGDLSEEESKRRLKILATRMDGDNNGVVSSAELDAWVYNSLIHLDREETEERFAEIDASKIDF